LWGYLARAVQLALELCGARRGLRARAAALQQRNRRILLGLPHAERRKFGAPPLVLAHARRARLRRATSRVQLRTKIRVRWRGPRGRPRGARLGAQARQLAGMRGRGGLGGAARGCGLGARCASLSARRLQRVARRRQLRLRADPACHPEP